MANKMQDVQMHDGTHMNYYKTDKKHVFVKEMLLLSTWQIILLIFIIIVSIIMSLVQISITIDVGNRLLEALRYYGGGLTPICP